MTLVPSPRLASKPPTSLKLSDFTFDYPRELIAKYPAEPRDAARLMVLDRKTETIAHRTFSDLPEYFSAGDVLVTNNTKVFPARLRGTKEKTGAKVEVFLLRELNAQHKLWDVIVNPARKVRVGNMLHFGDNLSAEVIDNTTSRGRTIRFCFDGTNEELHAAIDAVGSTPIPPYLKRKAEPEDKERYQTIFAKERGAVAAPTSALHFTPQLLDALDAAGVKRTTVTLHVGLGTFSAVEVEDLSKHRMDSENYTISDEACETINTALLSDEHTVTACGTTVVRAVESCLSSRNTLKAGSGWTDKFISPPYEFRIAERLITNFHTPRSTLLMLVSAFANRDFVLHAYEEAVKERYRLFSFGDAMLII